MNELAQKVFDLLGIAPGEEIKRAGVKSLLYKIDDDFIIWHSHVDNEPRIWTKSSYTIGDIINGAFEIIKLPRYTEADLHLAKGYLAYGYEFVARDKDEAVCAYIAKPDRGSIAWYCGKTEEPYTELPEQSFKNLTWDDEPLSLQTAIYEMEETK